MTRSNAAPESVASGNKWCPECHSTFRPRAAHQRWCSAVCKNSTHKRWEKRAKQLYHTYMETRRNRSSRLSLSDVNALVAQWNREDRARSWPSHDPAQIPVIPRIYKA